jgi:hypothetical protein
MIALLFQFRPLRHACASIVIAAAIGLPVGMASPLTASESSESKTETASPPAQSYRVDTIELPVGVDSEIGALTFNEEGELIVVTRHSGILIGTPSADRSQPDLEWRTFCDQILDNPVGVLAEPGGTLLVAQRHELTRLHDTDDDGLADYFEAIVATEAPITAGTQPDGEGNWLLSLATGKGRARWQGWTVKTNPDGGLTPLCSGIHQSGGIATDRAGNFFTTDRACDWNSEHALRILQENLFHGDPAALLWDSEFIKEHADPIAWAQKNPKDLATKTIAAMLRIPAGEFCAAPGELAFHLGDDDSFGPFSGQCFVADSGSAGDHLMRAMLELVEGKWQGSVARFEIDGLSGASAHRLCFSLDGTQLYIGQKRGSHDSKAAPKLQRITAVSGKASFSIQKVSTLPSGLQLAFTNEIDRSLAVDPKTWPIERHPADGGAPDTAKPERCIVSPDGRSVTLFFDAVTLAPNFRYAIDLSKMKSGAGAPVACSEVHHTIHRIPADLTATIPHPKVRPEEGAESEDETVKIDKEAESEDTPREEEKKG